MWKPLVVLAIVANTALITPSEGTYAAGPYSKKSVDGNPHRKCKEPNQIYDLCPNPCPPRECGVDRTVILCAPAPKPGSKDCKPGCICADGFLKNRAGVCIPEDECQYDCAKNETLDQCYSDCPRRFCGVNIAAESCLAIDESDCELGCRCRDGYLENAEGNCILEKDCLYDVCPAPCPPRRCDVDETLIDCKPWPRPGDPECEPGCRCADGCVRNPDGVCVTRDQCPKCYGRNEIYDVCPNPCPPQRCDVDPRVIRCVAPPEPGDPKCKPGCRCLDGYARNGDGICIPREKCPQNSCKRENEIYSECPAFTCRPLNCTQVGFPVPCPSPGPDPKRCPGKPGCICESGYARNKDGKCIPIKECTPKCGKDEVYSTCTNSDCGPQKCSQLGYPIPCPRIDPDYCIKGCVCREGLVRDANGTCIPKEKCPSCGGDLNAESGCGNNCGRLCSNYNSSEPVICSKICNLNGCDCKKGFVLDESTGKCILPNKCVSCNGDFNAKPGCDKNCTKRCPGTKPAECICKGSCECKDGFVYDPKIGKCVRPAQCTPPCGNNEILSNCSNGGCGPWRCTDVGIPTGCVKMDQKFCKVDCVCKEGYVRDDKEVCVPVTDCPECGGDPNAIAGCGINCGRLCSNYKFGENVSCIAVCYDNACDCRKGFVLDENINKCVKPKHCTPTCSKNEVFSECINGGCDAKNCSQIGKPVPCVRPAKCKPGCLCAEGYLRDAKGNCIPKDQCPAPVCKKHEVYSECINGGCQARNCSQLGQPVPCVKLDPKSCIKGCVCENGYLRARNSTCVPEDKCDTPVCKKHEVYSECINGGCQARNCSQLGKPVPCVKLDPKSCITGCVCEDGYLRARNGTCVPEDKCDNCNKPHEHYDPCAPSCPPQTCESIKRKQYKCPATAAVCKGACRCDKGYLRNKIGECIKEKKCLKCKGPHEYWSCGSACDNVCATLYKQNQTNCPIKNIQCTKMCYCEEGYARDKNNVCIRIDKCPKPKCGVNERLEECPPALCTPQKCSELGFPIACPDLPKDGSCPEPPGCVCADNYVRDSSGKCIPSNSCPSCGGDPNAVSGCGVNCGRTCTTYNRTDVSCIAVCYSNACDCRKGYVFDENIKSCVKPKDCTRPCGKNEVYTSCANGGCGKWNCSQLGQPDLCIDPIKCIGGCICQEGYLRAKNGTCVLRNQCPVPPCGKNERFEFCPGSECEPQYCSELGFPKTCPATTGDSGCSGEPACICNNGFVRNKSGDCIPKKDCPSCGGDPNAESGCGVNCGRLCSNYNKGPVPCPRICRNNACDCKKDFVLDQNTNKCVRPKQCTPICGQDEVFSECINGGCQPKNCSQLGKPVPCPKIHEKDCIKGCLCKEGYLRDLNGVCVPKEKCEQQCSGLNEVYDPCPPSCPPETCESIDKIYHCPLMKTDNKNCKPSCRCKKGYYRNKIGQCISKANCPRPCGKNEVYTSCANGGCGKWNCSQLGQPDLCIDPIKCIGGCICQEGFLRAKNGTCVPRNQCPVPPCGKNERFEFCPGSECEPQYCSELGFSQTCPATTGDSGCSGEPACICNNGFVRNKSGDCIPKKECPSCGGDPNAESGCGVNCGRLCSNYNKGPVPCPKICRINACDCKKDFVLDQNINKCVRPKQCTPICGQDEVFSECINGGCQPKNCSQLGKPVPCPKIDEKDCIKGCLCKEGYLRDLNGVCVPKEKCEQQCSGPNEVYDPCPPSCPPQTCESIDRIYDCPLMKNDKKNCKPSCRCKKGYYRNKIGQCISKANCLKCTGPYEYWSCGGACDNVCKDLHKQNQTNCPIKNIKCNEKCYCEKGYARNAKNVCVPIDQCPPPPPKCGKNERLEECPDWLCRPQSCDQLGYPVACPALQGDISSNATCPGRPGCVCIDNYVRHDCGECIPVDKCSSCGGDPNAVSGCGVNCGRLCSNYKQKNVICPLFCNLNGCDCKKGFVFDSNIGKCVLPKDCTKVCGNNEVYDICANGGCQKRNCSQLGRATLCIDPIKCVGGCVCQEGFLRNKDGDCVPEDKCPSPCTKPHEVYDPCPRTYPPQTCAAIGVAYPCPHSPEEKKICNPACRCEDGYYKNSADECISEEDCLKCTGPHEHFSCGPVCDNVCATLATENQTNCPYINKRCNSKCYCDEGYARDDNNICIPINQCGVSCNGDPNAISGCGGYCGNRCSNYRKGPAVCPLICKLNGCDCKQTYVFDDNLGKCVQRENCTPACGKDEVYNTCINGGCQKKKCSDLARPIICIHPKECEDGCLCKEGMLRADNGTCVPIDHCPTPVCPRNEVFERCANGGCDRRKCSDLTRPVICTNPVECIGDCVCDKGFLRNEDGICVLECECNPQCNKPHQVFNPCPSTCPPQTCESLDRAYICPIEWGQEPPCQPNCVCEQGYFFNLIGECISEKNCLKCMGPHEYFSCGVECDNVCATLSVQNKTNCPIVNIQCNEQCYCEDGYARNKSNICIPIEDCPVTETCYGEHKVFDPCPKTPRTCASLNNADTCNTDSSSEEEPPCKPGCVCEEGYYENAIGECSTKEECLKCTGPHEYYSCGGACDNVCLTLNEQNQTDCPIINVKCNEMCYCEEGYARNASNICIPIKDCPPSRCGPNERYEENPCQVCGPLTCSEVDMELECPPEQDDYCDDTPACICKYGLVRNEAGVCIPISECCKRRVLWGAGKIARRSSALVIALVLCCAFISADYGCRVQC